jgi:hypothetical protein
MIKTVATIVFKLGLKIRNVVANGLNDLNLFDCYMLKMTLAESYTYLPDI